MIKYSYSTLSFLANTSVVLPFFVVLREYNINKSFTFLITLIFIYALRATSVWLLPNSIGNIPGLNLKSIVLAGAFGFLLLPLSSTSFFSIVSGVLLGYMSANIWPYFLAYRTENIFEHQSPARYSALAFLFLAILIPFIQIALPFPMAAIVISIIYLFSYFSIPPTKKIKKEMAPTNIFFYSFSLLIIVIINLIVRGLMEYPFITKQQLLLNSKWDLYSIITLFSILTILIAVQYFQLKNNKLFVTTLFRGYLMAYILLYSPFFMGNFLGPNAALIWVYFLYILGFELGPILERKWTKKYNFNLKRLLLVTGAVFQIIPSIHSYMISILLLSLYLGTINVQLNIIHHSYGNKKNTEGIFIKYKLSNLGNQLFYLVFIFTSFLLSNIYSADLQNFFDGTLKPKPLIFIKLIATALIVIPILSILESKREDVFD